VCSIVLRHFWEVPLLEQTRRNEFLCVECRAHDAEVFCEQCHDYFCELCFGGQHRKGNRRAHTFQPRVAPANASAAAEASTPPASAVKDAVDYEVGTWWSYLAMCWTALLTLNHAERRAGRRRGGRQQRQ
jgi:hypothetical protein